MGLADQVKIEITKEGLRIELTDSANDIFFEIGTLTEGKAIKLLEKIGKEIGNYLINYCWRHTDSRQFNNIGTGFTNFELSSERALAAKRALVRGGLEEKHIDEIHGYADTRLRDKNNL